VSFQIRNLTRSSDVHSVKLHQDHKSAYNPLHSSHIHSLDSSNLVVNGDAESPSFTWALCSVAGNTCPVSNVCNTARDVCTNGNSVCTQSSAVGWSVSAATGDFRTGLKGFVNQCGKTSSVADYSIMQQTVPVIPGLSYVFSFWAKMFSPGATTELWAFYAGRNQTADFYLPPNTASTWVWYSKVFVSTTSAVNIFFSAMGDPGGAHQ
jgi:hypothetical protein